jgi:hypothetical protein
MTTAIDRARQQLGHDARQDLEITRQDLAWLLDEIARLTQRDALAGRRSAFVVATDLLRLLEQADSALDGQAALEERDEQIRRLRAVVVAAVPALAELDGYLSGDQCDHSVGICFCAPQRAADGLRAALAPFREEPTP